MPFASTAQKSWMFANHPRMAREWEEDTPKGKKLPYHVKKKKRAKAPAAWLAGGRQKQAGPQEEAVRQIAPLIVGGAETAADAAAEGINNPDHPWTSAERALVTGVGGTLGWLAGRRLGQGYGPWGGVAGEALGTVGGGLTGAALSRVLVPDDKKQHKDDEKSASWLEKLARRPGPVNVNFKALGNTSLSGPLSSTAMSSKGVPLADLAAGQRADVQQHSAERLASGQYNAYGAPTASTIAPVQSTGQRLAMGSPVSNSAIAQHTDTLMNAPISSKGPTALVAARQSAQRFNQTENPTTGNTNGWLLAARTDRQNNPQIAAQQGARMAQLVPQPQMTTPQSQAYAALPMQQRMAKPFGAPSTPMALAQASPPSVPQAPTSFASANRTYYAQRAGLPAGTPSTPTALAQTPNPPTPKPEMPNGLAAFTPTPQPSMAAQPVPGPQPEMPNGLAAFTPAASAPPSFALNTHGATGSQTPSSKPVWPPWYFPATSELRPESPLTDTMHEFDKVPHTAFGFSPLVNQLTEQGLPMNQWRLPKEGAMTPWIVALANTKTARDLSPGSAGRARLAKSQFALPGKKTKSTKSKGAYPIPDKAHARAAEGFCAMHHGKNSPICEKVRHKVEEKFGSFFF